MARRKSLTGGPHRADVKTAQRRLGLFPARAALYVWATSAADRVGACLWLPQARG